MTAELWLICLFFILFFYFTDTATTEIYTLSLHDALPISHLLLHARKGCRQRRTDRGAVSEDEIDRYCFIPDEVAIEVRSEEHTSELQSHVNLVCRLLLEKKNETYK